MSWCGQNPLYSNYHDSHGLSRLAHVQESKEMHALVVGLFKQDPIHPFLVRLETSDGSHVLKRALYHSQNTGDRCKEVRVYQLPVCWFLCSVHQHWHV